MILPSKADYRRYIQPVIDAGPAIVLNSEGFTGRALSFIRSVGDVKQEVKFDLSVRPVHARESAQLVLTTRISPLGAVAIYSKMLPNDPNPVDSCKIVAPIESIARERVGMWLFKDETSAASLEGSISRAILKSVVPYLKDASSAEELFTICQNGVQKAAAVLGYSATNRAALGAALAVSLGRISDAIDLVDLAYSENAKLRAEYGSVFSYLNSLKAG